MANDNQIAFLCSRLKEFREKNGCTMADMAKKIDVLEGLEPGTGMNKSSISRVEGGKTTEKTLLEMARKYCKVFGMSESQTEQFLRGEKAAVPDTSALLKNSQLIDELNKEYSKVVIPKVVVDELDNIKIIKEDSSSEYIIEGNISLENSFSIEDIEKLDKEKEYQESLYNQDNEYEENNLNYKSSSEYINKDEYSSKFTKEIGKIEDNIQEQFFEETPSNKFSLAGYNVIGTIFDTYIILSKGNSMYLLDQHAAHEKILYERYMDKFYKSSINMQMLLDPIVLELSNIDMLHVENNLDLFMKFGFEIELFGKNHIMIRCVPTIFGVPESEKFILQIIDNIEEIKNNYELKGEKFASMACRAAIKANDRIQSMEIRSLLNELETCENPFTCPHGRPTIVEITKTEIEKMFKRIM